MVDSSLRFDVADHPVLRLMVERAERGSDPARRDDQYKLALGVEGGGMRGAVTAGMVTGLEMLGLRTAFDIVYGSSSGAANAAYFVAGQAAFGTSIYYNWINNRSFISLLGPLGGRPIVNLDFAFHKVMTGPVPLDWKACIDSAIALRILATQVEDGSVVSMGDFQSRDDLFSALHASARTPLVAGSTPFEYRGHLYWDAAVTDPFSILTALSEQCTHLLVLRSEPIESNRRRLTLPERLVVAPHIARRSREAARRYRSRFDKEMNGLVHLERSLQNPYSPPYLFGVAPPASEPTVSRLETRRQQLVHGAAAGLRAMIQTFTGRTVRVAEVLSAFDQFGHRLPSLGGTGLSSTGG